MHRQTAEKKIVPLWAWVLAGLAFTMAQVGFNIVMSGPGAPPAWARSLLGLLVGVVLGAYLLLIGYVNGDARRRGMNQLVWTLVVIFVPSAFGFLLYFILRQPLQKVCPRCGTAVQMGFSFCPRCSLKLGASCPQCQRMVSENDDYCPNCGTSLRIRSNSGMAAEPAGLE